MQVRGLGTVEDIASYNESLTLPHMAVHHEKPLQWEKDAIVEVLRAAGGRDAGAYRTDPCAQITGLPPTTGGEAARPLPRRPGSRGQSAG